jgi:hypothetical protein
VAPPDAIQARLNQRRQELQRQAEATRTETPVAFATPQDDAPQVRPRVRPDVASSEGLSVLRQRLIEREREGQPAPPPQVRLDGIGKKTDSPPAEQAPRQQLGDKDFTGELLKRKKQDWRDDDG